MHPAEDRSGADGVAFSPPNDGICRRLRILVVDDNASIRTIIAAGLRGDGHDVQTADDGLLALALHTEQPFDVVLTDLIMPGMRGRDLATAVKEINRATPVFLITGYSHGLANSPFDLTIRKPFPHADLRAALDLFCG